MSRGACNQEIKEKPRLLREAKTGFLFDKLPTPVLTVSRFEGYNLSHTQGRMWHSRCHPCQRDIIKKVP